MRVCITGMTQDVILVWLATITFHNVVRLPERNNFCIQLGIMDKKKVFEVVILAVVIISVWMVMFLTVMIYFLVSLV